MLGFLEKQWWKYTSIILLSCSFLAGLIIPLSSGIQSVYPEKVLSGSTLHLDITGYNTHFAQSNVNNKIYLKSNDFMMCGTVERVHSNHSLRAVFAVPFTKQLNGEKTSFSLIIQNQQDGTFFLRKALTVIPHKGDTLSGMVAPCTESVTITKASGFTFPHREILYESIRNLFFHVPMWFSMILLLAFAFGANIRFLSTNNLLYDTIASSFCAIAVFFGSLGILTGMQWANFTWGAPWINDPKLNGAAVGMLIYLAYFVLRGSLDNEQTKARVSAVYGIFAFVIFIVFIFILPRLSDSLHPGSGGNPGFNTYDLDSTMRPVFYGAVFGFSGIGYWIASILVRYNLLLQKNDES